MSAPSTPVTARAHPLGTGPYQSVGAPFMGRYRPCGWTLGEPEHVFPMRVVRDDVRGVVGWLAPGTARVEPRCPDGTSMRDLPLAERFRPEHATDRVSARVPWRGPGILRLAPMGKPWSVLVFWEESAQNGPEFAGWYVNLENPGQREGADLISSDHVLDLWIDPDGAATWKDEDELGAAVEQGRLTTDQAACIRCNGEQALAEFRSGAWPFGRDWTRWQPPSDWTVPALPDDATWDLDLLAEDR